MIFVCTTPSTTIRLRFIIDSCVARSEKRPNIQLTYNNANNACVHGPLVAHQWARGLKQQHSWLIGRASSGSCNQQVFLSVTPCENCFQSKVSVVFKSLNPQNIWIGVNICSCSEVIHKNLNFLNGGILDFLVEYLVIVLNSSGFMSGMVNELNMNYLKYKMVTVACLYLSL